MLNLMDPMVMDQGGIVSLFSTSTNHDFLLLAFLISESFLDFR